MTSSLVLSFIHTLQNEHIPCAAQTDCCGNKTRDGSRRGGARRELKNRGRGMKDRTDKSMGIVTLIPQALAKIKPTEPLRFTKGAAHQGLLSSFFLGID